MSDTARSIKAVCEALSRNDVESAMSVLAALTVADLKAVMDEMNLAFHLIKKSKKAILAELPLYLSFRTAAADRYGRYESHMLRMHSQVKHILVRIRRYLSPPVPPRLPDGRIVTCTVMGGWRNPSWADRDYTDEQEHSENLAELRRMALCLDCAGEVACPYRSDYQRHDAAAMRLGMLKNIRFVLAGGVPTEEQVNNPSREAQDVHKGVD